MKVIGLDGRSYTWSFKGCRVLGDETRPRSSYHKRSRGILAQAFEGEIVFEEVLIPGTRLRCDFVIPARRIVVEVQGEQHFEYNPHFHKAGKGKDAKGSKLEYFRAVQRDQEKARFCEENNIRLIYFTHSETDDEWRQKC